MGTGSYRGDVALRMQTASPKLRWRTVAVFLALILILSFVSFINDGIRRVYYGILAGGAALVLVVQYRKEQALVTNRLVTTGVVTDWGKPLRSRSRFVDSIASRFPGNIPLMKYSFIAFDQKTYTGQTGWGARDLHIGASIPVLYDADNPVTNHPLNGFIFYSFHDLSRENS